ncbi:MAG: tRNA uridine(34) 5-carboxymethylaminomethyl modification radical SAM/GNAT enzyme Elp3 [Chloroflexi bacterium]|nr:tRNA uridine(34) 5-carboxymethylaminomethyl modification radical SAM/GNAT enzyme Elp3 [Chloroflexota bacterium]
MASIDPETWQEKRIYSPEQLETAREVLEEMRRGRNLEQALRKHPQPEGGYPAKHLLVAVYRSLVEQGEWQPDTDLLSRIRMKPVRTLSGVTTVTVLTKPYPCPGKCIFCPTDARMPKSYLPDEPGARRGLQHHFDPYDQVRSRIEALEAVGHPTEKIELLILGGTWSAYRRDYQEWFVRRCFDALNASGEEDRPYGPSPTLEEAQCRNENGPHRNVGLVVETRPDRITPRELAWMRRLGVTKVQMGAQSLDDRILAINQRGHTAADTLRATALLRAAGFKIVLHWMPNLLGATLDSDRKDFGRLWASAQAGLGYSPDEIKIYPCELLPNAELIQNWERGEYQPYTQDELVNLIAAIKPGIPRYCRVNRVIRDIPSTNVVAGNKRTSLRQDVHAELARRGQHCSCIRCREVGSEVIDPAELHLQDDVYYPAYAEEHFLSYETVSGRLAGYLRLSLPLEPPAEVAGKPFPRLDGSLGFADLENAAIIREVHVYGQSLPVGVEQPGAAQHIGLGTSLLHEAEAIACQKGFARLAVISAIGTRPYYEERGFERGELYLIKKIK